MLFDKTGTLTVGTPEVREVLGWDGFEPGELLRLAASVDQMSAHVLGEALARSALDAGLMLTTATDVREEPGQGIQGVWSMAAASRSGAERSCAPQVCVRMRWRRLS